MVTDVFCGGKKLFLEEDWRCFFFSSPYAAHRELSAVDIRQHRGFGSEALSPVAGTVFDVKRFDSPTPSRESLPEYLLLIDCGESVARIMHVEPTVSPGDRIEAGDALGRFIKNGFFTYWVDAVMHLEMRRKDNLLRAIGGYEMLPSAPDDCAGPLVLSGEVAFASERNVEVLLDSAPSVEAGDHKYSVDWATCLGYGGILGRVRPGEKIYFDAIPIGNVEKTGSVMSTFRSDPLRVRADCVEYAGLSMAFSDRTIRLLPEKHSPPQLRRGDCVDIEIEPM